MLEELSRCLKTLQAIRHARIAIEEDALVVLSRSWRQQNQPPFPKALLTLYTDDPCDSNLLLPPPFVVLSCNTVQQNCVMPYPKTDEMSSYDGVLQVCTFKFATHLTRQQSLQIWRDEHANVACDNQSTSIYIQNHVIDNPNIDAIVEEMFPLEAMTNPLLFFAASDKKELSQNLKRITASSNRFIDMSTLNATHLKAYNLF